MSRRNTLRDLSAPPTMRKVKRGDAFLPGVDVSEIESLQAKNTGYKIKCILQAALLRKAGRTLRNISKAIGFSKSTIYGWLERLAVGGLKRIHDNKSPGRSCRLSVKQQNRLKRDLGKNPDKSGFLRGSWTAKIVVCHIKNKFKVTYGASGALRLTKKLGFSVRCARPVPYNCATPEKQDEYVCETIKILEKYDSEHYKVVCVDAAAFVDAPSSARGIRVKGGKDTVTINFSKKSIKIIGALGQGTFDMQFHQKTDADSVIALLEYLRYKYGRVFVILDNAGAHTGKRMDEYIESTKGDVVLWFLPPRTPQHNPIEVQWREIRRAVADLFFGGLDELQKRIRQLLHSGEVPIVKLFGYMQGALKNQNGPWYLPRTIPIDPAIIQR